MNGYEAIRLVTPNDPEYVRWRDWNKSAARERRAAALASRAAVSPSVPRHADLAVVSGLTSPPPVVHVTPDVPPSRSAAVEPPAEHVPATTSRSLEAVPPILAPDQRSNAVARGAFARDAEYLIRRHLRRHLPVSERRILRYAFQKPDGRWTTRYRELDVVALDGRRLYIFEIKATKRVEVVTHGIEQLRFVREVLSDSFLDVITTLLVVDTDAKGGGLDTPVSRRIVTSPELVRVARLRDLTTGPVIHAIPLTIADVEALSSRPLDLSWRTAA